VAARGGAAFADWFAEDGVELSNGQAPLIGKAAIAKHANWSAKDFQLSWTPTDADDGAIRRHGVHLGPLRGPQQRRERQPGEHQRALHDHLAQAVRTAFGRWSWTPAATNPQPQQTAAKSNDSKSKNPIQKPNPTGRIEVLTERQIDGALQVAPMVAVLSCLCGRGDWLNDFQRTEPPLLSYSRGLARHMDRIAAHIDFSEPLCQPG
jgi:hypothetical protein